ncbi:MAG: glutathione peroxidase [Planctomycetota bacterium]
MARLVLLTAAAAMAAVAGCSRKAPVTEELIVKWEGSSLYDIEVATLEGRAVSLDDWRGQVTLVVNTASQCGLTPQYAGLQRLHERFGDRGFAVLGFPSGDFMGQEFDSAGEIREFCTTRFGVGFPLFAKTGVKPGAGQSPVFEYLGTETGQLPAWNFGKYLVGRDGRPIAFFGSRTDPEDASVIEAIEAALAAAESSAAPRG